MIKREDLVKIGKFNKPHGIKGEISFTFTNDSFDESECPFLICELDGIFVPFHIEEYRFKSDSTALIKFKNIDSDEKVRFLTNLEVFFSKEYLIDTPDDSINAWDYFIGFTLIDERTGQIGVIADVDESTINTLFIIEKEGKELLIPANDDMITHINEDEKQLFIDLPEGLLDI